MAVTQVVIPCCGMSTRFPGTKPKYLLTDYSHVPMVYRTAEPYLNDKEYQVNLVILREHEDKYGAIDSLIKSGLHCDRYIVLDDPTNGPADTVYQAIFKGHIPLDDHLLIRDCDSFFSIVGEKQDANVVYTYPLSIHTTANSGAKSYVQKNSNNIIYNIVEKKIVSDDFCVGGYQFAKVSSFVDGYRSLLFTGRTTNRNEVYVSDIIMKMLSSGEVFYTSQVSNYVDVGTLDDWYKYNNKPTIFCDIDGTIIESQSRFGEIGKRIGDPYKPLVQNINALHSYRKAGAQIIFTTARGEESFKVTRDMLDELGFESCRVIMGLHHSKRIVINDFSANNPYPSAVSINVPKDMDMLEKLMGL